MELPFPEKIDLMTRWEAEFSSRINTEFIREESWKKVPMEFDRFQQQLRILLYFGLLTREERK
jgi:hypothetical protein